MNYTRTAAGLLSAQYRSVLKKCFLINMGLFALGAVPATATEMCPAGYKCYGVNFGDEAEKYPEGHAHAGEMITLPDTVYTYTGYNTQAIWSGDYSSNGQITINHASGGELIIRNSTIDMNNNVGFVLQGIPPVNASLTLHLLNTEIKNGQVAQWGAGFYDSGKFSVEAGYGHNQIFENVTFTNNRVTGANSISYGGALYIKGGNEYYYDHQPVKTQIISSGDKRTVFNQNYVSNNNVSYFAFGGGLYNCNSELSLLDADFTGNYTKSAYMAASEDQFGSAGGAIINHLTASKSSGYWWYYGRGIINQIYGTYTGNYSTWVDEEKSVFAGGGAIFNAATIGDIGSADKKAVFTENYAKGNAQNASHVTAIGGAIANYGDPNTLWQPDPSSSSGYNKYQGGISGLGKIGNIYADFTDNYVQSVHNASLGARGGALANFKRSPLIGNITGNFTRNRALAVTNGGVGKIAAAGGAISNDSTAIMGNVTGDFRENKAYNDGNSVAVGGAIYNAYALGYKFENNTLSKIGGVINSNFYDNVAESTNGYAFGGAIFTAEDLMIKADNGTSVFQGNKTISKSALEDKEEKNEAIYVNKTSSTSFPLLELVAVNGGTLTFYDSINGSLGYKARLTGDADSHINLYNDIKNAYVTADSTNISTADGNIKEYDMYNLVADNTAKWTIDFSVEGEEADSFATDTQTGTAGKVVQIDHFNLIDKAFNEITNKNFKVQILKTQGTTEAANLQLALTTRAASELGGEFVVTQEKNTVKDAVTENTNWSRVLRETGTVDTIYGTLVLATTDTFNDSIGLNTRNESTDYDESLGDTLMLVNTADLAKRNFNADQATYKVSDGYEDIGVTHAGELNINGQGKNTSILDGNGAALFDLSEVQTTVSLNDVKITNAKIVAKLTADDAVLNLNNVEISGNQNGMENNGTINLNGVNKIADDISGNGITNVNSDWQMESKISGNTVNVNNAKLTVGPDNLTNDVKLHATYGGNLAVGNNLVSLKTVQFDSGSQLTLNVDDLNTFGGIRANAFDITQGSKIDITFGQDVLKGQTEAHIPLLALTDGSDINNNNFEDVFHNNMYKVKRLSNKSGIYMVEAGKTAREISRENGGTQTNQDAAGAWVDGPSQKNPIVQGIANDLARFAQTDGRKFNEELTAVAPSESAVMNFMSETNNRIFYAVDNHLRTKSDDQERQPLYDINIWAVPYYGESEQKDVGKVYGYDSKSYGIIAGIDKQITQHVKLGIGGRYEETDISSKRRDYDVTTSTAFAYGEYKPNEWFINGVVKYDFADWDEKRYAVKRIIKANYRVDVLSANMTGGYEYRKNTWLITPQAGLRWHRINRHGYTDTALQTISGHNTDILSGVAGLRIQNNSEIKGHKIHPSLYAGITYDINSGKDGGVVTLTNGTSYHYEGATMKRFAVEVSPSIAYDITDKLSVAVEYTGAFRKHYQNHTASVGVNYQF